MSVYKELYYWTYSYFRENKTETDKERADSALMFLAMWQLMNFGVIYKVINVYLKFNPERNETIISAIIIGIIILFMDHFYLFKRREEIFQKYDKETPKRRKRGKIIFWLYIVGSVFLFFFFGEIL